jgi:hypothetical protein
MKKRRSKRHQKSGGCDSKFRDVLDSPNRDIRDPNTLRDTHRLKKQRSETTRTYRSKRENPFRLNAPRLID